METALIGIDFIRDLIHADGRMARSADHAGRRGIVPVMNEALAVARRRGWLTVLVKVAFARGYPDQPKGSPMFGRAHEIGALEIDTPGTAFHSELDERLADLVVVKPRISAFYGTNLDAALRARQVGRVVLAGVSSAWAIQSTARDAHDRDFEVFVLEDACAAATEAEHQSSMALLGNIARLLHRQDLPSL